MRNFIACGVCLLVTLRVSAFENLDFEQITTTPPFGYPVNVPGWRHIGANSGGGDYWNVNSPNLSGWAEPVVVSRNDLGWGGQTGQPLAGDYSIALTSFWPDPETGYVPDIWNPPPPADITRAWIGQTGTIPTEAPWLTLITDYTGPLYSSPGYVAPARLIIDFAGSPVRFTLEDLPGGGWPLKRLWADLESFAGQTGELRIGVEGRHWFSIDDLQFVPEPSAASLLLLALATVALSRMAIRGPRVPQ